jgi:hypothetical protein
MNVGRGLLRAWIVVCILWIAGAGSVAYIAVSPDTVRGSFQPAGTAKVGMTEADILNRPFYETMRSPSAEKLYITFRPVGWQDKTGWEKNSSMAKSTCLTVAAFTWP